MRFGNDKNIESLWAAVIIDCIFVCFKKSVLVSKFFYSK